MMIVVGLEFGAVFIERDSMTEEADRRIGSCKWKGTRHYSDRANRIPISRIRWRAHECRKWSIPHADKFYLNIHRESLLKRHALLPASFVIATEHLVRKRNLLVVPRGEQAHLEAIGLDPTLILIVTGANLMNHPG
jgi:hypothetical protein